MQGVLPLWNPFVMWGTPTQIYLNYVGIYNPLWVIPGILTLCGIDFYHSFIWAVTLYFGLGQAGFYYLAKLILKDDRAAYVAFILFLFSSLSLSLFIQFHPPLIYVPSIWFFYFLISFVRNPRRSSWLGLTLTSAVILTSYLPFYFLTIFLLVALFSFVFCFSSIKSACPRVWTFVASNIMLIILSAVVICLAFIPGYEAYLSTVNKEVVAPFRNESIEKKAGVEIVNYGRVSINSLPGRMALEDLYSGLDAIQYGDDCFFYMSLFFYIILIAGAFVRFNRRILVFGATALILFFIMITDSSAFHRLLFDHIFYFHLIRNMHFFMPFFIGVMALLAGEIMHRVFQNQEIISAKFRVVVVAGVLSVHVGLLYFLKRQEYIIFSSYLVLILSMLFWVCFIYNWKKLGKNTLPVLLFIAMISQPIEVMWRHNHSPFCPLIVSDFDLIRSSIKTPTVKPVFAYQRPIADKEFNNNDSAHCLVTMTDASQFYPSGFPVYWSFNLMQKIPSDILQNYTKNKFYLYDNVKAVADENLDIKTLSAVLKENLNLALVSTIIVDSSLEELVNRGKKNSATKAEAVTGPSEQFQVLSFTVNAIRLHITNRDKKFLVYTDGYHKNWTALVNGQEVPIYRANMAFKGIVLPPGDNRIEFRFNQLGYMMVAMSLHLIFMGLLISLIWIKVKENGKNKTKT